MDSHHTADTPCCDGVPVVASTRLDPPETPRQSDDRSWCVGASVPVPYLQPPPLAETDTPVQTFRHSGWAPIRNRVHRVLHTISNSERRARRFRECGSDCWVLRSKTDPGKYCLASNGCNDRFCLPCGQMRARTLCNNLAPQLRQGAVRMITLTVQSDGLSLDRALDKLLKSFRKLCRRPAFRGKVPAGVALLEVKRTRNDTRWHPHLHLLAHGKYVPKDWLSKQWRQCTGDSYIVDVKLVRDPRTATKYVTKYVTKPLDASVVRDEARLREAILALKHRRLVLPFGAWRKLKLSERPRTDEWETVGPLYQVAAWAKGGDERAFAIMQLLLPTVAERVIYDAVCEPAPRPPPKPPDYAQLWLLPRTDEDYRNWALA